jgi:hypothetical protein
MSLSLITAFYLILAPPGPLPPADAALPPSVLDSGYRQMYNLQFDDAHRTFRGWEQSHPQDPLGPASDAAAYLFAEFDRLGVLQSQLFTDDEAFKSRHRVRPDPASKQGFESDLDSTERIANSVLARDPHDRNALFAQVLDLGLRADYLALIERRDLSSLSYTKRAGVMAQRLITIDPSCYDAYMAVGIENYILGLSSAPVRWILRIYGAETDKNQGIQQLRLAAEKGHYLLPFARLLLAVAALRDHDRDRAREILAGLARDYPNNQLYARELARLQ